MFHLRKILLAGFLFLVSCQLQAQLKINAAYLEYITQYKDLAIEEMKQYRIPASITLAQGLFESAAGHSRLATEANNHFGIKCHDWQGRSITSDDDALGECFRAYDSPKQSFDDHSLFLRNNARYARLFQLSTTDYRGWAYGLKDCGYATNPQYADKLIQIIELYQLYQYDTARTYDHYMANTYAAQNRATGLQPHIVRMYNKNYYVVAREGDTFKSIAKEAGVSWRKLARYNEIDRHTRLHEGDIIYLEKKQKHAIKAFKRVPHVVKAGESMYTIAQMYGIRIKNLYKMNHMKPEDSIRVGQALRVY